MKQPRPIVAEDTIAWWRRVNGKFTGNIGHSQIFSLLDSHEVLRAQRDVARMLNEELGGQMMECVDQYSKFMFAVTRWAMEHPHQAPTLTDLFKVMKELEKDHG